MDRKLGWYLQEITAFALLTKRQTTLPKTKAPYKVVQQGFHQYDM